MAFKTASPRYSNRSLSRNTRFHRKHAPSGAGTTTCKVADSAGAIPKWNGQKNKAPFLVEKGALYGLTKLCREFALQGLSFVFFHNDTCIVPAKSKRVGQSCIHGTF